MDQNNNMEWSNEFSVDNTELDSHHKKIMDLTAELQSEEAKNSPKKYASILTDLMDNFVLHFKSEEAYMEKHNYPHLVEHKIEHRTFIFHLALFNYQFSQEIPTGAPELYNLVKDWIYDHEINMDFKYRDFIKKMRNSCFE